MAADPILPRRPLDRARMQRATIFKAPSGSGRCNASASGVGAVSQVSTPTCVVRITSVAFGWKARGAPASDATALFMPAPGAGLGAAGFGQSARVAPTMLRIGLLGFVNPQRRTRRCFDEANSERGDWRGRKCKGPLPVDLGAILQ